MGCAIVNWQRSGMDNIAMHTRPRRGIGRITRRIILLIPCRYCHLTHTHCSALEIIKQRHITAKVTRIHSAKRTAFCGID
ncbi:hypothetical protein D3C85_1377950 [compost metagenome]